MTDAMKEIGAPMSAAKSEWRGGWPIVLCATIGVAFYALHYAVMGAIMLPLTQAYGWTRGEVAFGLTIASLIGPLANVMAGVVGDRFGPRPVALFGALLFGASYAMFSLAGPALWSWYAVSALFAICSHFAGPIIYTMAVVRQFSASRGLALALHRLALRVVYHGYGIV
jgi:MFS family permease